MNIIELHKKFNTQRKCIEHLEKIRWGKLPTCPYCNEQEHIADRKNEFRYQCNNCGRSFSVLVDTVFEDTNMPLPIWFQLIALMINSKMGVSSKELGRQLGITQKSAWFNAMKVRCAMLDEGDFLDGIVEMDEAYMGGKPRKPVIKYPDNVPILSRVYEKRGRGTRKVPVVGIVARQSGQVATKVIEKLTTRNLLAMFRRYVKEDGAILITDEFSSYKKFDEVVEHLTIDHTKEFARGVIHTNTIEGFWSLLKNGIKGNFRAISKKYLPFYLAEYSYKYSKRRRADIGFSQTIKNAVAEDKCLVNLKPKGDVKKIVYKKKKL
ncbi:MAG: IS1595 family transposase [Bacteroidetes bacterium]|nr:MAG: IS1595 family transposase [Bacteroidota bacterium]